MFTAEPLTGEKSEVYEELARQANGLFAGERDWLANAANLCALIFNSLPDLNWTGFYLLKGRELVLGPFQGKPACIRIAMGKGVCGTTAARRETVIVEDVNKFAGHIACDAASQSEVVVPLVANGSLIGVLDLDSPHTQRFDGKDRAGLERLAALWLEASDLGPLASAGITSPRATA